MQKTYLFLLISTMVVLVACSNDAESPVSGIEGIWVSESIVSINEGAEITNRDVWQFNEDYTGTYKESTDGDLNFTTTFTWSDENDTYAVNYSNAQMENATFTIGELLGKATLQDEEGFVVALKE
ncbi:MAG: hypothetical protein AAGA86_06955 [Bacteroidota bacterium]